MKLQLLAVFLLTALAIPLTAAQHLFPWPDSNAHWRVLVNVNEYIQSRPPTWFTNDKLITDLQIEKVTPQNYDQAVAQYDSIRQMLEGRGMYVGTYMSGTTVYPPDQLHTYPQAAVTTVQMPPDAHYFGSWPNQPGRKVIDVADPATRHDLQEQIITLWRAVPAPERFIDNAAFHRGMGDKQPWSGYCDNMREIRVLAESQGSRVIFNIAAEVASLSDEEVTELEKAVGDEGICLEMPWSTRVQGSPDATEKAKARYRQLLDSGMAIVVIPVKTDDEKLASWIRTWKKPGDHLYMNGIFWKSPNPHDSISVH